MLKKLFAVLLFLIVLFVIATSVGNQIYTGVEILGNSMAPSYTNGQRYRISKIAYLHQMPARGDVVVMRSPFNENISYTKRIIALPNETIRIREGKVLLNGNLLDESAYLDSNVQTTPGSFLKEDTEISIPPDHFILMGDNRPHTLDSRDLGPVAKKDILGKFVQCVSGCNK